MQLSKNLVFRECFLSDIPGFLTYNINTLLGLANGTEVKYHSLSFANDEERSNFIEKSRNAEPGSIVELNQPPLCINVEVYPAFPNDDEKTLNEKAEKRRSWKYGSLLDDGKIVIPLTRLGSNSKLKYDIVRGCGGHFRRRPSKVKCANHFALEPAFALTLHKVCCHLSFKRSLVSENCFSAYRHREEQ